jgi:hypothetical protein
MPKNIRKSRTGQNCRNTEELCWICQQPQTSFLYKNAESVVPLRESQARYYRLQKEESEPPFPMQKLKKSCFTLRDSLTQRLGKLAVVNLLITDSTSNFILRNQNPQGPD